MLGVGGRRMLWVFVRGCGGCGLQSNYKSAQVRLLPGMGFAALNCLLEHALVCRPLRAWEGRISAASTRGLYPWCARVADACCMCMVVIEARPQHPVSSSLAPARGLGARCSTCKGSAEQAALVVLLTPGPRHDWLQAAWLSQAQRPQPAATT